MRLATKSLRNTVAMLAIALLSLPFLPDSLKAQSITPAQDGTNTVILQNGQRFDITGGTQAGANLFQSFQQFGLSQGQIANFLSQPNIQNILSRVVGGDPSVINGLIQVTGGNSNLYILNPAGIILGANANLNVPAAFTATTANGIQVGNGWFGINTSANDLKNLIGNPNAFAFTNSTVPLSSSGQTGVILNQGNLTAPQGQSITLVGGIVINTGTISTPNGKINIVAVPDGKYVRITPEGGVLSLDLPIATQQELGATHAITGIDLPKLLTGSGIVAPTMAGEAIVNGQLNSADINILANRYNTTQASLNAANIQQGWNLVFVDSTVKNYQTLIDGTKGGSSVTVINPDQYGIQKITTTLADITGANSLHIVSEGDAGNFWLGKDFVSSVNVANYSTQLQAWRTALSPAATILLYACNLANGENGVALVQAVKTYTGHEVAASTDRTGGAASGGNWNLEYQTGKTPATVIFNDAATNAYQNSLAIFTTTNINDSGAGSLRAQILSANAAVGADEIRFDPIVFNGAQGSILLASTLPTDTILGDLFINGGFGGASNITISGQNTVRVFTVSFGGTTTFDSLKIINGNAGIGVGGGIAGAGTLNLNNSTVSGNTAILGGGIGLALGGTLTLNNSVVTGNTSTTSVGGGIYVFGDITLNNSTVSNNTTVTNGGGIASTGGVVTLNSSTVSGNTAGGTGGGISTAVLGQPITVVLNNSTVTGNTSGGNGGGINNDTGAVTLNSTSSVTNNIATTGQGGGINALNITVNDSTVSNNTAGAGLKNGGGIAGNGSIILNNSNVLGNIGGSGGGIINNGLGATTIANSNISNNMASFNGGGIRTAGSVTVTNSTLSGNTAGFGVGGSGGGIASNGALTFTNSISSGNKSDFGGGIWGNGITLANSIVSGNTGNLGGGILGNVIILTNSTVTGNTSSGNGGGIWGNGTVTLNSSTVAGNTALGTGSGGGIFGNSSVTLSSSTVSGNTSINRGGGIYGAGAVTLTNSTVSGNTAGFAGGGIELLGSAIGLTVTNSTISGNTTGQFGGGIDMTGNNLTLNLINSTVSGNKVTNGLDAGGGIWGTGTVTIANSTITGNTASGVGVQGGGLYLFSGSSLAIANSIIIGNSGLNGAEIFNNGSTLTFSGANIVGTNGVNGISGGFVGVTPIIPTGAANTVIVTTLANNGGATQTHMLLPNSIAINASTTAGGAVPTTSDQRSASVVGVRDLGAVETQGFSLTPLANTTPQTTNINTSFANFLGVQITEDFINAPVAAPGILVTFTTSSSAANGSFAGNANVFTNNLGIAFAPTFTANGIPGIYSVSATANGFNPASFALTNKVTGGFGGVYPSREDANDRKERLEEQEREDVREVLCVESSLVSSKKTGIPLCKE